MTSYTTIKIFPVFCGQPHSQAISKIRTDKPRCPGKRQAKIISILLETATQIASRKDIIR